MYSNDNFWKITPPATMADLAALDATRETPYLKARCNRMGLHIPNPNPPPAQIIPYLETRLEKHIATGPQAYSDCSADYFQWKSIKEDLEEFISWLKSLIASAQNSASTTPPTPEPKSDQNRPENEPSAQPAAAQQPPADQNRTESESDPDQNRPDSEPPAQNISKQAQILQIDPEEKELQALLAQAAKLDNLYDAVKFAIHHKLLPDPDQCGESEYRLAFFDRFGPPRRCRLDRVHPNVKTLILSLLEEFSLQRVQDRLLCPPPIGAYLVTSKSALRRFRISEHAREAKRNQRALRKQIEEMNIDANNPAADFIVISEKLLKLRLVESSLHPDPDLTQTKTLIDMLEKIHAGKLAERKVALAESKG